MAAREQIRRYRRSTQGRFFRYDYFDEFRQANNGGKGLVGWYTHRVKNPAQAADVARLVDQEFENSRVETKAEPEGAFVQGWASQIGNIALIVAGIVAIGAGIALALGLFTGIFPALQATRLRVADALRRM